MPVKKRKIVISDRAVNSMKRVISHLQRNGFLGADKAKEEILRTLKRLSSNPESKSRVAKFGRMNGDYRSVLAWNYRIYYRIGEDEIVILDMFLDKGKEVKL